MSQPGEQPSTPAQEPGSHAARTDDGVPTYRAPTWLPAGYYHAPHYATAPPDHPRATPALVLGIVGLVSLPLLCGLGLLCSPFAWWLGASAVSQIDAAPGRYAGRGKAQAGLVMGIVGTALLVLVVLAVGVVAWLLVSSGLDSGTTIPDTNL
jgi:hypothetical protein